MNNEMILTNREQVLNRVYNMLMNTVKHPLDGITSYYSRVLEREVDNKQTLSLLNAQLAFFMTVFPADCSFVLRILCGCWLVAALLKCKELL